MAYGKIKADTLVWDNSGSDVETTIQSLTTPTPEGTVVKSTGETGTAKFLRVDGDGTCSWQVPPDTNTQLTLIDEDDMVSDDDTKPPSQQSVKAYVDTKAPTNNPTFTGTVNAAALTLSGDLTVGGTTTTVSSTTIEVADKNIELGKVSTPTDTTADGGGITLKGATDKTWNWVDATDAWTSNQHIHIGDIPKFLLGTDQDAEINHNGSNLYIQNTTGNININAKTSETAILCVPDGAVELYHDNSKKIETTAAGVTVTGTVSDSKGDVRDIPTNSQSSAYEITSDDAGKIIYTSANVTLPSSTNVSGGWNQYGGTVTIINKGTSDISIIPKAGQGMEFYIANDTTLYTTTRTLAPKGLITVVYTASQLAWLSGSGIS